MLDASPPAFDPKAPHTPYVVAVVETLLGPEFDAVA
jgi:hypothetical protein